MFHFILFYAKITISPQKKVIIVHFLIEDLFENISLLLKFLLEYYLKIILWKKNDSFKFYVSEMTEIFKYLKKTQKTTTTVHVEININFNFTKILWFC